VAAIVQLRILGAESTASNGVPPTFPVVKRLKARHRQNISRSSQPAHTGYSAVIGKTMTADGESNQKKVL
jgi:hypothetical protein